MATLPEGNVAQYPTWRVLYRSTISRIMFQAACAYPFHVWWTWIQFKINAFDVCPPSCVEGLLKHVCKCIIWTIPFNGVADLITYEYWSWYPIQYYIYKLISSIYILFRGGGGLIPSKDKWKLKSHHIPSNTLFRGGGGFDPFLKISWS